MKKYLQSAFLALALRCINCKCFSFNNFFGVELAWNRKCININCISCDWKFFILLACLAALYQLESVSPTAEKRVWKRLTRIVIVWKRYFNLQCFTNLRLNQHFDILPRSLLRNSIGTTFYTKINKILAFFPLNDNFLIIIFY